MIQTNWKPSLHARCGQSAAPIRRLYYDPSMVSRSFGGDDAIDVCRALFLAMICHKMPLFDRFNRGNENKNRTFIIGWYTYHRVQTRYQKNTYKMPVGYLMSYIRTWCMPGSFVTRCSPLCLTQSEDTRQNVTMIVTMTRWWSRCNWLQ